MRITGHRQLLKVAMSVAAIAAASAAPALAAPDQIAYRCDVDVCLVNPDAPGVTNLSANGATSFEEIVELLRAEQKKPTGRVRSGELRHGAVRPRFRFALCRHAHQSQ